MVTQGQGLSKRDFERILAGARLVAEHTNLKRCVSIGHMSAARATALKEAGIQRVHHNVETAESYYPEVSSTVRYEGRLRTIDAVRDAGLETCVGGILNLGESNEQRVEMAFQLAEVNPTSVPINLLNPRPGTQFRRPRSDGSARGRQVGRDLPADHPRRPVPACAAAATRTSATASSSSSPSRRG
jgi:biotin synthase